MARCLLTLLVFTAVTAAGGAPVAAETTDFVVIVHPSNGVRELDRDFVRDVYLKKIKGWGSRSTARPIDLGARSATRERFVREVIRKSPVQLRNYWNQQIFSGKGVPPVAVESPAAVIAYVLANPGAIGYIPAGVDPGNARVVRIR